MRRSDDDLLPFRDDPVFRALTGPGTPEELAGEAEAVAAFRAGVGRSPRRFAARVGTSGAVAAAAVALSGGVAAAYTASFPAPVQRVLHEALSPIDIPAPKPDLPQRVATSTARPSPLSAPVPSRPTDATPARTHHASPKPSPGTPSAQPTTSASPTATPDPLLGVPPTTTPSPTPSPTSTQPVPIPGATLVITTSDPHVLAGQSVTITGSLQDETGSPVVGRRILLAEHLTGVPGWNHVDASVTSSSGEVSFTVPDLEHSVRFALRAGDHVHSAVVRVAVEPTITEQTAPAAQSATDTTVTVKVVGAEAGDEVAIVRPGRRQSLQTATLDSDGQAVFTIPVPTRPVVYRLLVRHTKAHSAATLRFTVSPPAAPPS